ncbi:MAG: elongation factor Ts [Candidatus Dojkabacteria bacterium]|nr:elongation factor Ts [Candidatus Dojkabacteria bacterium]
MVDLEKVKEIRNITGASIKYVIEALDTSNGDIDKAMKYLREKGFDKLQKRQNKVASQGIIGFYYHNTKKMCVLVEILCETDFAANSDDMLKFANQIALNIAALSPKFINIEDVPQSLIDEYVKDCEESNVAERKNNSNILSKFYEENVLMCQKMFNDPSKTIMDYLNEFIAKIGEKIVISKFVIMKLGEDVVQVVTNKS